MSKKLFNRVLYDPAAQGVQNYDKSNLKHLNLPLTCHFLINFEVQGHTLTHLDVLLLVANMSQEG